MLTRRPETDPSTDINDVLKCRHGGSSGLSSGRPVFDANPRSAGLGHGRRNGSGAVPSNDNDVIVTPSLHPGPKTRSGRDQMMKVLEFDVKVGDGVAVGGLQVFPLTSEKSDGPPYLTGPAAYEAGLIEVSELDPPEVPLLSVTNLADLPILLVEGELLYRRGPGPTMNVTVLCPPRALIDVPVSCVESGRWGSRRAMSPRTGMHRDRCGPPRLPTWNRGPATPLVVDPTSTVFGKRSSASRSLTVSIQVRPPSKMFRKKL